MSKLYQYFGKGLIILVPIFITFFVLKETYRLTESVLDNHFAYYFPGLGFIVCMLAILLTGYLFSHWMLEGLLGFCERVVGRIPIVNFIYQSVKKLSEAVFDSKQLFNQAVLVAYPNPETRVLGFKVKENLYPIMGQDGVEYSCVFVPWSLNMTSGINLIVPTKDLTPLDISGEEALQFVLTAGSVIPNRMPPKTETIIVQDDDKADAKEEQDITDDKKKAVNE